MSRSLSVIAITLLSFGLYFFLSQSYFSELRTWINKSVPDLGISHVLVYLIVSLPIVFGASVINEFKRCQTTLGLNRSITKGILFPLICTIPMVVGFAICFSWNKNLSTDELIIAGFAAAFFEEFIFRGFLFGQLFRFTKLGFIPSILLGALLFAAMHLYQSRELATLIGVFATTFMGAILFSWLFAEWNYNLWIPIFLHLFMNLAWMLFAVSDNAFGGVYANIFRIITIALAIVLTLAYKKKKRVPLNINKETIWMKNRN
ncbi:CPBP family intramembrane glutamic endopeptidase [Fluviicola chungangensis]|uniref:CPBP family intramembrane metalloprotease n=1 Tax=Fluviicola chungangensis TaxID=2597671 RepID=A0A556N6W0_9FLAO|nr:CPBP family intramembrane glutamic endopeptidase [Fluviicola chungangensis]TSJ47922.1 CPBP family intramembrane metalloprotease [Fluviicola chungangensis]